VTGFVYEKTLPIGQGFFMPTVVYFEDLSGWAMAHCAAAMPKLAVTMTLEPKPAQFRP